MKYGFTNDRDYQKELVFNYSELLHKLISVHRDERNWEKDFDSLYNEVLLAFTELINNPPEFDIGRYWEYYTCAACIAASRWTDPIWEALPKEVTEKLDLIMELFLYIEAIATNNKSEYTTGFHWDGHYNKHWNANHKFANYGTMFYVIDYFGGDKAINEKCKNFDFDALMERVRKAEFTRCYDLWTAPPVELEPGLYSITVRDMFKSNIVPYVKDKYGNIYDGGVSEKSITDGYTIGRVDLAKGLFKTCYNKICSSNVDTDIDGKIDAHIYDNTISPVEGQLGMISEFESRDNNGARSSIGFAVINFIFATALYAYCKDFGYPQVCAEYEDRIIVGNTDLLYKVDHGYVGYVNGHKQLFPPKSANTIYPTFSLWREYWENNLK